MPAARKASRNASRRTTGKRSGKSTPATEVQYAASSYISPDEARRLTKGASNRAHPAECICTVCTCGAHKCPPDRVEGRYYDLKTSYSQDFKGAYVAPAQINRPQYIHKPRPFVGTTTNQDDFMFKGMPERRKGMKLQDNGLLQTGVPFAGITTSQHDYRKWQNSRREPMKQQNQVNEMDDDRDFNSESAAQYTLKPLAVRQSRRPQNTIGESTPFEGITTNQSDFQQWNSRPAQSFQKFTNYRSRPEDRDFVTDSRATYTLKKREFCPAIPVAVASKPENGHVLVEKVGERYCHKVHMSANDWEATQQQQQQMPLF